ncbi:uncharacterized protein LOC143883307 isoform X2 [Tasmannia lanceolata]|uniref:uncharacterized protein LOC143883307 isoform X2 n=1 Tax=Tasmannia lanceolata TaxID=3420 RepID=UPI0040635C85
MEFPFVQTSIAPIKEMVFGHSRLLAYANINPDLRELLEINQRKERFQRDWKYIPRLVRKDDKLTAVELKDIQKLMNYSSIKSYKIKHIKHEDVVYFGSK